MHPLAVTYSWTGPNNFASANQNPVISNAAPDASGVYNVTATATQGNCQSLPGSINVVVNPTPAIRLISSINPATCSSATGSITFSGLLNSVLYTVNFKKNGTEQSANISTNQSGELVLSALTSGTYSEITVLLAGCSSKVFGPYTLTDPNPPATPVVTGNSPVCSGGTLQLSVTNSTSSTTYLWTGPDNFTSSLKDVVIANVPVTASGAYIHNSHRE